MRILEILLQIFSKYGDVATDYKLIVGNLSVVKREWVEKFAINLS